MERSNAAWSRSRCLAFAVLGAAMLPALPASAVPAQFKHRQLAKVAVEKLIIPGYKGFGRQLASLQSTIGSLCRSPSIDNLQRARQAYRRTIAAWGKVEIIQFGPVTKANRLERIFYWPDRKGRGSRQVRRLISATDKSALTRKNLAQKSVAVQGLTALELVLFGKRANELSESGADGYACRYGAAVADNVVAINRAILDEWQPNAEFGRVWHSPGPDNQVYLKPSEVTLELVKALDHGLENLRDRRIAPVLGFGKNRRRKARPVLWRSKNTMVLVHANIEGLRNLLFQGGLAEAYIASRPSNDDRAADLMESIRNEFGLTLGISGKMADEPDPFAQPDIAARLVPIGFPLRNIRHNAIAQLKSAAGLAIGFNASDGD